MLAKKEGTMINRIKKNIDSIRKIDNLLENKHSFITTCKYSRRCAILTTKLEWCRNKATYVHSDMNKKGEKYKKKMKVSLCKRHANQILETSDHKTVNTGFYFESDLYRDMSDVWKDDLLSKN